MKIINIEKSGSYFTVTFIPNWLEKMFGVKEKKSCFKYTGNYYTSGGGAIYINSSGEQLCNSNHIGKAIDLFRRQQYFEEGKNEN